MKVSPTERWEKYMNDPTAEALVASATEFALEIHAGGVEWIQACDQACEIVAGKPQQGAIGLILVRRNGKLEIEQQIPAQSMAVELGRALGLAEVPSEDEIFSFDDCTQAYWSACGQRLQQLIGDRRAPLSSVEARMGDAPPTIEVHPLAVAA